MHARTYIASLIFVLYLRRCTFRVPSSNSPPPLPSPLVTTNLISFSMNVFVSEAQQTYNTILVPGRYTTLWFDISIHFKTIITISLVTICHHTNILHNFWLYSPHCTFHAGDSFILQLKVCNSVSFTYLSSPLQPSPLATTCLFSVSIYDCFCFVICYLFICFVFRFHVKVESYNIYFLWLILNKSA